METNNLEKNNEIIDVVENIQSDDNIEAVEQTIKPSLNKKQITLELGDIIEIIAPPNETLHENTFFIDYVDSKKMIIIDTANDVDNDKKIQLNFNSDGTFTDESITQIILLDRSEEKGYARQNNLLVGTWIDIEFGGEIPRIISGEITNLEEDKLPRINYILY